MVKGHWTRCLNIIFKIEIPTKDDIEAGLSRDEQETNLSEGDDEHETEKVNELDNGDEGRHICSKKYEDACEVVQTFLDENGVHLYYDPDKAPHQCHDDLQAYTTRLVATYLLDKVHSLMSKNGDGNGLRAMRRLSILQFLSSGGQRSKYALNLY